MAKDGQEQTGLLGELTHPGRPRDEEPHIKRSVKKKKENIEYIVRVNLKEIGIDEITFDELQELFRMFDNDKDGVLSLKEFEKILVVLGRSGENPALLVFTTSPQEQRRPPGGPPCGPPGEAPRETPGKRHARARHAPGRRHANA